MLAGGLGTRLRERVVDLPKPMAPVAGRPFLEYVLDRLIQGGIKDIVLSVGYMADTIIEHFGDSYRDTSVRYSREDEPLGTGGAIVHALGGLGDEPHMILNGDTLLAIDYSELLRWYEQGPADMAMVLRAVTDVSRYGAVLTSGDRVIGFAEKGQVGAGLINAGVYILRASLFRKYGLEERFSLEADLLQPHCQSLATRAYVTDGYFVDIGVPEDYDRAQRELPLVA